MKRKWSILLSAVLCFGLFAGCGGTAEEAQEEAVLKTGSQEDIDPFPFTVDEFISSMDERLALESGTPLSEYKVEEKEGQLFYMLDELPLLIVRKEADTEMVNGIMFYADAAYISDEEIDEYSALLVSGILVIDPEDAWSIVADLDLSVFEEGTKTAEGKNATYNYTVKDYVGTVTILPTQIEK